MIATLAAGALKAGRRVQRFEAERYRRRRQTDNLTEEAKRRRRAKHAPKASHQQLTIAPGTARVKRCVNRRGHVATEPGLSWDLPMTARRIGAPPSCETSGDLRRVRTERFWWSSVAGKRVANFRDCEPRASRAGYVLTVTIRRRIQLMALFTSESQGKRLLVSGSMVCRF